MRMLAILPFLASVILRQAAAQGGAESLAFPGYLPGDYVKAPKPFGDDHPNDIYEHIQVRLPALSPEEVVIYPHHFGFEYGQDPEHSIYEVHNAKELQAEHNKKHGKKHHKHNKHGKHAEHSNDIHEHHDDHHHHHHEHQHEQQESRVVEQKQQPSVQEGYKISAPENNQFRPRPAYPPKKETHPHFG